MRRLIVEIIDNDSLTSEQSIESLHHLFGHDSIIKAFPKNNTPEAHLEYAISELMADDIVDAYFELYPHLYEDKCKEIKQKLIEKLTEEVDRIEQEILKKLE